LCAVVYIHDIYLYKIHIAYGFYAKFYQKISLKINKINMKLILKDNAVLTDSGLFVDNCEEANFAMWCKMFSYLEDVEEDLFVEHTNWFDLFKGDFEIADIVLPSFAFDENVMQFIAQRDYRISGNINSYNLYLTYMYLHRNKISHLLQHGTNKKYPKKNIFKD
jgi:hypothetical protein